MKITSFSSQRWMWWGKTKIEDSNKNYKVLLGSGKGLLPCSIDIFLLQKKIFSAPMCINDIVYGDLKIIPCCVLKFAHFVRKNPETIEML